MNKYQEALDVINQSDDEKFIKDSRAYFDKYKINPVSVIQELVDKETPMKRKKIYDEVLLSSYSICPKCNSKVSPICCYCENCGQRLE